MELVSRSVNKKKIASGTIVGHVQIPGQHLITPACTSEGDKDWVTYNLCERARSNGDICPEVTAFSISACSDRKTHELTVYTAQVAWIYLSYAVDVLKEITKPRAVPSTVISWLLKDSCTLVIEEITVTTERWMNRLSLCDGSTETHRRQPR